MRLYKVVAEDGTSCHGGTGAWPLPVDGRPGAWLEVTPPLQPCGHGLHLCRREDLVLWLGPAIWEAEVDPAATRMACADKVVVSRARLRRRVTAWTPQVARRFAADCAERALEGERAAGREPDARSWAVVAVARDYAAGRISMAAWATGDAAAGLAAARAYAEGRISAAAWATGDAAGAAASAAHAAAWAARAAIWAAGEAASAAHQAASAARAAIWVASGDAAARAARGARAWQTERLWEYLDGEAA